MQEAVELDEGRIVANIRHQLFRAFGLAAMQTPYPEPTRLPALSRLLDDIVDDAWLSEHVVPEVMHWRHRLREPARVRELLRDEVEDRLGALWDEQLDVLGLGAPVEVLEAHLARAPAGATQRDFLASYLAAEVLN